MRRPSKPLENTLVVEMGSVVLAPYAAQVMADMGADVIKVEPPTGDNTRRLGVSKSKSEGMGSLFLNCNRGKKSLSLNLKHADGIGVLHRLLARADVMIHNMRGSAAARLGIGYSQLVTANPRLVYCSAYGYGAAGRYAAKPAYDDVIQAGCGMAALRGRIDGKPSYAPTIVADKTTALFSVIGIMGALMRRGLTGRGEEIEIAMFETMAHYMSIEHLGGFSYEPPAGPGGYARLLNDFRRPHKTKDGFMAVLPYTAPQWKAFFDGAGRPEVLLDPRFCDDAGRTQNIDAIYQVVSTLLPERTNAEWTDLCTRADIPHSPVNDIGDLVSDLHLKDVGFWQPMLHPTEGPMLAPSFPVRYGGPRGDATPAGPAPLLGQHTLEILGSLGYVQGQIEEMLKSKVAVAAPMTSSAQQGAAA
jgi:crotonobetainyl-CoA:carnitine CoA-transferase CaiB-like acyl-CoA transferase